MLKSGGDLLFLIFSSLQCFLRRFRHVMHSIFAGIAFSLFSDFFLYTIR